MVGRRRCAPVSGALGAVGLAFAATPAPVAVAPGQRDAPRTLALLDETTGTLIAGSLVSIDRIPDLRDVDGKGWPEALAALKARKCIHLVPAFGRIGSCYVQNANRAYLRMERDSFND